MHIEYKWGCPGPGCPATPCTAECRAGGVSQGRSTEIGESRRSGAAAGAGAGQQSGLGLFICFPHRCKFIPATAGARSEKIAQTAHRMHATRISRNRDPSRLLRCRPCARPHGNVNLATRPSPSPSTRPFSTRSRVDVHRIPPRKSSELGGAAACGTRDLILRNAQGMSDPPPDSVWPHRSDGRSHRGRLSSTSSSSSSSSTGVSASRAMAACVSAEST